MGLKLYGFLGFPIGLFIFSLMMFWFYYLAKYRHIAPLKKYMSLFVGYLFTWLGGFFLGAAFQVPAKHQVGVAIPAIICLFLGLIILIGSIVNRLRGGEKSEVKAAERSLGGMIGGLAAGIVLVPMFLLGLMALIQGKVAGGLLFISPPLLFFVIFYFVRRSLKRRN